MVCWCYVAAVSDPEQLRWAWLGTGALFIVLYTLLLKVLHLCPTPSCLKVHDSTSVRLTSTWIPLPLPHFYITHLSDTLTQSVWGKIWLNYKWFPVPISPWNNSDNEVHLPEHSHNSTFISPHHRQDMYPLDPFYSET